MGTVSAWGNTRTAAAASGTTNPGRTTVRPSMNPEYAARATCSGDIVGISFR